MTNQAPCLSAANIRYLLVLAELDCARAGVRCTDVADMLQVSRPSVHSMMSALTDLGLIIKGANRTICFTPLGQAIAKKYSRCFGAICAYLNQLLPSNTNGKAAACALLAELPLEALEHMCARMGQ